MRGRVCECKSQLSNEGVPVSDMARVRNRVGVPSKVPYIGLASGPVCNLYRCSQCVLDHCPRMLPLNFILVVVAFVFVIH